MRIPKKFRNINQGALEVRMQMTPNDATLGRSPRYGLYHTTKSSYDHVTTISIHEGKVFYAIKNLFDLPGESSSVLGFAFTKQGAEEFAYRQAVSLANKMAGYGLDSIHDLVKRDKEDLERTLRQLKGEPKIK